MSSINRELLSGLTLRLSVCGIPRCTINPFAGMIEQWARCSGEEWTISRLKAMKVYLIMLRSGQNPTVPFARNREGQIRGVVGSLLRWGLKSDKNFVKVLSAFMAYTHWYSSHVTGSQRKKFLDAVNAPSVTIPKDLLLSLVETTRRVVGKRTVRGRPTPLLVWQGSSNKRAPTLRGSVKQTDCLLQELKLLDNSAVLDHVKRHRVIYDHVFAGIDWQSFVDSAHEDSIDPRPMVAGEVHFLQEPGYKLRSIASPYRLFQVASEPLKDALKDVVASLPWDVTHDQTRAFPVMQEALRQRRKVFCLDLSNATDYFPLELQEAVLSTVFTSDSRYVSLVSEISRANWLSDMGVIRWNRGQPLGFNPSFFLFTLTHGLLLLTLLGKEWDREFFVVGDDVVILDEGLYLRYRDTLSLLGCPYSKDKTLVSNEIAEFVGKVVTPYMVIPQLKWRSISDDNFLDLARLLGPRIRKLLTKKQNHVLNVFAHVADEVHPYGLNWSYPGSNRAAMVKAAVALLFEERVLSSLTGLSARLNHQLYADNGPYTQDFLNVVCKDNARVVAETFDEKVISVFRELGYSRHYASEYFLEGLAGIPQALKLMGSAHSSELPLESKPPARVTLLQRLLGFLRKKNRK